MDEMEPIYEFFENNFGRQVQILFIQAADRYDHSPESKGPHAMSFLDFMKSGEWLRWAVPRGSA